MPAFDEIREHQQQSAGNRAKQEAREYVASLRSAVEFARMDIPPIEWFVPGLIAPGLTIIAGQSGAGKSWLLLQLGLAVSCGGLFIGNLRCRKADVLYIALEDNDRRIKSRLQKLGMALTRDFYIDTTNIVCPQNINAILDEMPTVQMVIIDTLGRYLSGEKVEGNDYQQMTAVIEPLHTIAKERNIAVVICTHTKKGAKVEDGVDAVIGSKATVGVSDTIMILTRKLEETEGKLYAIGRDFIERTIEMEHTEDWLWYDKKTDFTAPLTEFEQWQG